MSEIYHIDDKTRWINECFKSICEVIEQDKKQLTIGLSGGCTPKPVYARLHDYVNELSERKRSTLRFFVVDERNAALGSPESNSSMILRYLDRNTFVPFDATKDCSKNYSDTINERLGEGGKFDLIVLGCGEDGHIASIFPNSSLLKEHRRGFYENILPEGTKRFSLSLSTIKSARKRVFFVGKNSEKVKYFTEGHVSNTPVQLVLELPQTKALIHV